MIENRSVPPDTVLPHVMYQDVDEAYCLAQQNLRFLRALPLWRSD